MIASISSRDALAIPRCRRNSLLPGRLAPSAMLRTTLDAARLHWLPSPLRSSSGNLAISGFETRASALACCHAINFLKCPMRQDRSEGGLLLHQIRAIGGIFLRPEA